MEFNILSFCDSESSRYSIDRPWRDGTIVCATDGRIAIEVHRKHFPFVGKPEGRVPRFDDIFAPFDRVRFWRPLPALEECEACGSSGLILEACEVCKGSGGCACDCGNEHECEACDGQGETYSGNDCKICIPTVFGRKVRRFYMNKIAKLPDPFIGVAGDDPTSVVFFKFTDGRGAVAAYRED